MITNNHPAHAPLTSRRLHQMRDILSKASAQRDGGDIGYAMADAVKLIDEVLSGYGAEPVAYADPQAFINFQAGWARREWMWRNHGEDLIPLYAAPQPATVVPHEVLICDMCGHDAWHNGGRTYECTEGHVFEVLSPKNDAKIGNSPVIPDGWVMVPKNPTEKMLDEFDSIIDCGADDSEDAWRRLLSAAPQQEVIGIDLASEKDASVEVIIENGKVISHG